MKPLFVLFSMLALAGMNSLQATTITWNFTGNAGNVGHSLSFTNSGITVTASAWGLTGNNNTTFAAGTLGQWGGGLGVCNAVEGSNCSSPSHTVDNEGQIDFILLRFSVPVDPLSVVINPSGNFDRDVTYYTGNVASNFNLAGKTLAQLAGEGFGPAQNDDSTVSSSSRTVNLNSAFVNAMLIGARVGGDSTIDRFKLTSLTGTNIPEPMSLSLVGLALLGASWGLRRKS